MAIATMQLNYQGKLSAIRTNDAGHFGMKQSIQQTLDPCGTSGIAVPPRSDVDEERKPRPGAAVRDGNG